MTCLNLMDFYNIFDTFIQVSWFIWTALSRMHMHCTSRWTDFLTDDKKPFSKVLNRLLVLRGSITGIDSEEKLSLLHPLK